MSNPLAYKAKNVVTTYVDDYGETRTIHAPRGKNSVLRRLNNRDTPSHLLNRAVAMLMAEKIRDRRKELGLSSQQFCVRAGLATVNHKQFVWKLENAFRNEGVRLGTLYALASALDCEPSALIPSLDDAKVMAGVTDTALRTLEA